MDNVRTGSDPLPPLIFKSYGHGETLFKKWLYWPYNTYIWCYIGYRWCYIGYIGPIMVRYWLFMAIMAIKKKGKMCFKAMDKGV